MFKIFFKQFVDYSSKNFVYTLKFCYKKDLILLLYSSYLKNWILYSKFLLVNLIIRVKKAQLIYLSSIIKKNLNWNCIFITEKS